MLAMKLRIQELLDEMGRTQAWLCEAATLPKRYVSELCSNKRLPSMEKLDAIARAMEVEPGRLFAPDHPPGFSEGDAVAWLPYEARATLPAPASPEALDMARDLARHANMPRTFVVRPAPPGFGLQAGDVVVADFGRVPVPGDLLVTETLTPDGAGIAVRLRRLVGDWLVSDDGLEQERMLPGMRRGVVLALGRPFRRAA